MIETKIIKKKKKAKSKKSQDYIRDKASFSHPFKSKLSQRAEPTENQIQRGEKFNFCEA